MFRYKIDEPFGVNSEVKLLHESRIDLDKKYLPRNRHGAKSEAVDHRETLPLHRDKKEPPSIRVAGIIMPTGSVSIIDRVLPFIQSFVVGYFNRG